MGQPTCEERITKHLESLMAELDRIQDADGDEYSELAQEFEEGILCIQVPAWDVTEVETPYVVQVQFSWGGPADGLLVEIDQDRRWMYVRYYFQDWFDYAERYVPRRYIPILESLLGELVEMWIDENEGDLLEYVCDLSDEEYEEDEDAITSTE